MVDFEEGSVVEYTDPRVNLVVESDEGGMYITHANLSPEQTWHLIVFLINRFSDVSGIPYNEVCSDLTEVQDE